MRVLICFLLVLPLASGGSAWLEANANPDLAHLTEVAVGESLNPFLWPPEQPLWGGQALFDWREDGFTERTVRHLAGLAALGAGDTYPDPLRGETSLSGELRDLHELVAGGAVQSWHLWGLRVIEATDLIPEAVARLTALQREGGSVPCNPNFNTPNVDCTSWAVMAVAGENETFHAAATNFIRGHQMENGGFRSSEGGRANLQATIWAATALELPESSAAHDFVRALENPHGKFHCTTLEEACAHAWATAEGTAFLGGAYPLQPAHAPVIVGPSALGAGETGTWTADVDVAWQDGSQGRQFTGSFQENTTLYAHGTGWAKHEVIVHAPASVEEAPFLPLLLLVGFLGLARHQRK